MKVSVFSAIKLENMYLLKLLQGLEVILQSTKHTAVTQYIVLIINLDVSKAE